MKRRIAEVCCASGLMAVLLLAAGCATPSHIDGVWEGMWGAPEDFADVDPKFLPGPASPPAFKPEYQAKYDAILAGRAELTSGKRVDPTSQVVLLETTCLPYGMPTTMMGLYPLEILQTPGQVTILAGNETRRIYLNKPQAALEDIDPGYWGHSVGHWEGNTLVVDTIGIKTRVIGTSRAPLVHSSQMRITERIRLVAADLLYDELSVTDPIALEQPYTATYLLKRVRGLEMMEYVCDNIREGVDEQGQINMKLPAGLGGKP